MNKRKRIAGEEIEKQSDVEGNSGVRGEEGQGGVEERGDRMRVYGDKMHVIA